MGVYIRGMKMPKTCEECIYFLYCDVFGKARQNKCHDYHIKRLDGCPLVEVKEPHGRLVDESRIDYKNYKMHKDGKVLFSDDFFEGIIWLSNCIGETPTVIEAEDGCFFSTAEVEPLDYCSCGIRKSEEESVREVARGFIDLVDAMADLKTDQTEREGE